MMSSIFKVRVTFMFLNEFYLAELRAEISFCMSKGAGLCWIPFYYRT